MKTLKTNYILFILIIAILAVYWQALLLPFIQDDWAILANRNLGNVFESLKSMLFPESQLFYRPLGQIYLFFVLTLFGFKPLVFHITALIIHAINSLLLAFIVNKITEDRSIACVTCLIYATAIAVHLDTLAWIVGIYDLGGAFCFFLSLLLFLHNRVTASLITYFIGCLFKEAVIILPAILFSYGIFLNSGVRYQDVRLNSLLLKLLRSTLPYFFVALLIVAIKVFQTSHLHMSADHPYALNIFGFHVLNNLCVYILWMFQSLCVFLPVMDYTYNTTTISSTGYIAIVLYLLLVVLCALYKKNQRSLILFLTIWLLAGLLPVIFLPNHVFRYYCTYSLPAFIMLFLIVCRECLFFFNLHDLKFRVLLHAVGIIAVASSACMANMLYREGLDQHSIADGTNMLIRRAAFVDIIKKDVMLAQPRLPQHAVIVIARADLWAFDRDSGPQLWYGDSTIRVYDFDELKYDGDKLYVEEKLDVEDGDDKNKKVTRTDLDPETLFIFQLLDGKLEKVNIEDARQYLLSLKPS